MQAVIMAGGKGTRLTSITQDLIPKPMVEILGKPLLEWQIEILREYNITDICFVIGHLGEKIKEYFGNGEKHKVRISYIEEREPLGTAGAFYYLNDWLEEENFFLIFGDVFFDIDLKRMLDFHIKKNSTATLFVHPLVYEGATYLPLRAIGELMGKNVNWDQATQTVSLSGARTAPSASGTPESGAKAQRVSVQICPEFTVMVDGVKRDFTDANGNAVYPLLYQGSTYLPLRAIGELMGKNVSWDNSI